MSGKRRITSTYNIDIISPILYISRAQLRKVLKLDEINKNIRNKYLRLGVFLPNVLYTERKALRNPTHQIVEKAFTQNLYKSKELK